MLLVFDLYSEDECMEAYWRFFAMNGQLNSLYTNGITYEEFR